MSIKDNLELADAIAVAESSSLLGFHKHLVIDSVPPRLFGDVADPWQWDRLKDYDAAFSELGGYTKNYSGPRWFWDGMPRGHDKTAQIARLLLWVCAFSRRKLSASIVAGDLDQVQLDLEAMRRVAELNPWLGSRLDIGTKKIVGPSGTIKFLTADGKSNFGAFDDLYVVDEVTNWVHEKGKNVWDSLVSGIAKRKLAVLIVLTNAGYRRTWQERVRDEVAKSSRWKFRQTRPGEHLASWMDRATIAEMRKLLTPAEARRVIDNIWIDASEECGYLTREEVSACVARGRELQLTYRLRGERGVQYFLSVDYGPKNDRTALCVLHRESSGVVVVDRMECWQGSREHPIRVEAVEQWLDEMTIAFNNPIEVYDPYQMLSTIQKREFTHQVVPFESQGGKKNYEMAENLRSLVVNGQLAVYDGAGRVVFPDGTVDDFVEEVCGLLTKRMPYGYRFDHELNQHDDRAVAVGMAALECVKQINTAWTPLTRPGKQQHPSIQLPSRDGGSRRGLWGMR